jgi:putative membrane protein
LVSFTLVTMGVASSLSFCLAFGPIGLAQGLIFGVMAITAPVIASDLVTETLYRGDPLLNPRRISIISFVWCLAGGALLVVFGILSGFTGRPDLLLRGILLTVYSSVGIRTIIFSVFSTRSLAKTAMAIGFQPLLMLTGTYLFFPQVWQVSPSVLLIILALILLGPVILLIRLRLWSLGPIRIIPLFRGFVYAWAEQYNETLEDQLATISESVRLEADELSFSASEECLGNFVAPYIHPGPFRNVGSSCISTVITDGMSCETLVVHGISSHDRDMVMSRDMERIVSALKEPSNQLKSGICTPMVRAEVSGAKASCQIFGSVALLTLTLSPKSHDDIPDMVKDRVREAASKQGLEAVIVDAHNCLDSEDLIFEVDEKNLIDAAENAMIKAKKSNSGSFNAGFRRIRPSEWGPNEGMGTCGIGVLVVETNAGKNAYIVFDSNNIIQGLREEILARVSSLNFVEAEVMSSDTHMVNAIGATDRGYHPAGEMMEHKKVIQYVEEALKGVELSPAEVSFMRVAVDDVPIIGIKGIEVLRDVVKTSFSVFIRTAAIALPLSFVAAVAAALLL